MDWNARTIKTYDESAEALAAYFKGIGSRVGDIESGLKLANTGENARVVEIGCGDGRDAEEIVKRTRWYEGFDPSERMLDVARKKVPGASFVKADALTYQYPENLDVVYAFASLLHVNREDMRTVLAKVAAALHRGGIAFISLKERPSYTEEVKEDRFGKRMFYYYNPMIIKELVENGFVLVHEDHKKIGDTDWFTLGLQKV